MANNMRLKEGGKRVMTDEEFSEAVWQGCVKLREKILTKQKRKRKRGKK